jgi:hypothetical protein
MRGPLFWIVIGLVVVTFFGRLSNSGATFVKVDTSTILADISANKVESALLIDHQQKIQVVLLPGNYV